MIDVETSSDSLSLDFCDSIISDSSSSFSLLTNSSSESILKSFGFISSSEISLSYILSVIISSVDDFCSESVIDSDSLSLSEIILESFISVSFSSFSNVLLSFLTSH